ncbi:MAG: hypothetical protein MZU95_04280 [Desulfomicrobium escambiense]|nr:hypothetical protein [Desulfomicrobium escambiense]
MWEDKAYAQAWNFGPEKSSIISVSEIVNKMIEIWEEKSPRKFRQSSPTCMKPQVLMLDITKAKEKLQWKPCFDINEALINTVSWYKMYYNNAKSNEIKEYSLNQIENYCKKAEKLGLAWAKQNLKAYKNENRT